MTNYTDKLKYDSIDTKIHIKKFFKLIFRCLSSSEKIRVFQNTKASDFTTVNFFNNIDDLVEFSTGKTIIGKNTYFQLATTDGHGGTTENLKYRYCLAFDFDKKDFPDNFTHKDILSKFKSIPLHYHALVDSGNGYHAYVCINRTDKIDMVDSVQKVLCDKLGADKNAIKKTQILRIPYTYNIKNRAKRVNIIHIDNRHNNEFKPYDIEFLYEKNCTSNYMKNSSNIAYSLSNITVPKCIETLLLNGSPEHNRNNDLNKIVVTLRKRNMNYSEILNLCKHWNTLSNFDDSLEYRIKYAYDNMHFVKMDCKGCSYKTECYNFAVSDFNLTEADKLLTLSESHMSRLKPSNRTTSRIIKPNDLLVYCVLKSRNIQLYRDDIIKELTPNNKCLFSKDTLTKSLQNLQINNFIDVSGRPKLYELIAVNNSANSMYSLNYSAIKECIIGNITPEELHLYIYIRYLHHKEQREGVASLKGNLFVCNQYKLAEHLKLTQSRISQMIKNLLKYRLLSIWDKLSSQNNGFSYNIYQLNY